MKKLIMLLLLLLFIGSVNSSAESVSDKISILSSFNKSATTSSQKISLLQQLRGDTITIDLSSQPYTDLFTVELPDTIWLKKKPKKNPVEGKHYILNYAFKGQDVNGAFMTPSFIINNKEFGVLSVESVPSNSYISSDKDIVIKLIDLEDLSVINFWIPYNLNYSFQLFPQKINKLIDSFRGKKVYIRSGSSYSSKYIPAILEDGNFIVTFDNDYLRHINSEVSLNLVDENGYPIPFKFSNNSSYSLLDNKYIIGEDEYEENFGVRTINSNVDMSILNSDIELPFDFIYIIGIPSNSIKHYSQTINPSSISNYSWTSNYKYAPQKGMFVGGVIDVKGTKFYKMIYNGKAFFMKADDVTVPDEQMLKLDTLINCSKEIQDYFFHNSLAFNKGMYAHNIEEALDAINSYKSYGLAIQNWGVYDESEFTEGTGVSITFFNPTEQVIKYISVSLQGYNAVDDPVGRTITKKCIGPIEPAESATYSFEYVWFTDIVEYAKIKSITVTYKNGTTKTISNPSTIMLSDDILNVLFTPNEVDSLD